MKKFLCGIFTEEAQIVGAVKAARAKGIVIYDVYTPYAVHGLDDAMGIRRSRLPWVCLGAGAFGGIFALGFQMWTFQVSWPVIVGGKPFLAIPAFIPVMFEMTVLLGGLATVAAFFLRTRLFPGGPTMIFNKATTDHRFCMAVEQRDARVDPRVVKEFFRAQGAVEVTEEEKEVC